MEAEELDPLPVRIKYYTTLVLGLVSCLSCFVFMFCVPFFLEPSIATLVANFDPDPITCRTVFVEHHKGMKNCSWSSCRHGCTVDQFECDRIYVDYMMLRWTEYNGSESYDDEGIWAIRGTPVFVNIKACGYPPTTNCTIFSDKCAPIGSMYPCHYSRTDPSLVITDYSWGIAVHSLIAALIIPNLLTGVSLGVLSYWWYPGCQKRSCQYEMPPDQEASLQGDEEKEDLDDDEDEAEGSEEEQSPKKEKQLSIQMPDEKV